MTMFNERTQLVERAKAELAEGNIASALHTMKNALSVRQTKNGEYSKYGGYEDPEIKLYTILIEQIEAVSLNNRNDADAKLDQWVLHNTYTNPQQAIHSLNTPAFIKEMHTIWLKSLKYDRLVKVFEEMDSESQQFEKIRDLLA